MVKIRHLQEKRGKDTKVNYLEAINETAYLSVPNAPVYRKIMRCFYREYEKMNFQLYKEDYSGKSEQLMKSVEFVVHKDNMEIND